MFERGWSKIWCVVRLELGVVLGVVGVNLEADGKSVAALVEVQVVG